MHRLSVMAMVLAAFAVPALLALGVHLAAGSSLTAPPAVVARVSTAPIAAPSVPPPATTTTRTTSDHCAEPEHRNEARCTSPGSDDRSGRNSGKSDNSGSGHSGSGGSGRSGGDD